MKRVSSVLPAVAATTLLLTACGSSDTAGPDAPGTPETTTSAAETSAAPVGGAATSYELPGTGVFPEGITADDDTFFVTSTTDGAVFRGTVDSPDGVEVFLPGGADGRTGAAGIDVVDDDDLNRLVIAGGASGQVWVYDSESGDLVGTFSNGLGEGQTFLNDVVIDDDGDAYITDSSTPTLFRISAEQLRDGGDDTPLEAFLNFEGTPFTYQEGFNANGIAEADDDNVLVIVQSNTGALFRIDTESREVSQVDLGGATLNNGDGLEMDDDTLYVVRNRDGLIAEVDLSDDGRTGEVTGEITDPSFAYPTTVAAIDDRLFVVNSQFDQRGGEPVEPFTVTAVPQ